MRLLCCHVLYLLLMLLSTPLCRRPVAMQCRWQDLQRVLLVQFLWTHLGSVNWTQKTVSSWLQRGRCWHWVIRHSLPTDSCLLTHDGRSHHTPAMYNAVTVSQRRRHISQLSVSVCHRLCLLHFVTFNFTVYCCIQWEMCIVQMSLWCWFLNTLPSSLVTEKVTWSKSEQIEPNCEGTLLGVFLLMVENVVDQMYRKMMELSVLRF